MTQAEIIEGNSLLADFIGGTSEKKYGGTVFYFTHQTNPIAWQEGDAYYYDEALPFHKSWEWLMPVVEKIKKMSITDFSQKKPVMNALYDVDKSILWKAAVNFIKQNNSSQND
jgi:hypothetical protein